MTVILLASSLPGAAERLARKSTCDEGDSVEVLSVKFSDVWPYSGQKVFGEDFLAVFVDLTEPDCPESCPLGCECEPADPAEEVKVSEFHLVYARETASKRTASDLRSCNGGLTLANVPVRIAIGV